MWDGCNVQGGLIILTIYFFNSMEFVWYNIIKSDMYNRACATDVVH